MGQQHRVATMAQHPQAQPDGVDDAARHHRSRASLHRRPTAAQAAAPPSGSQPTAWPSEALLSTFSDSSAHFIRVAEMSIPSRSSTNERSRLQQLVDLHALDLVGGHRGRGLRDRAAVALEARRPRSVSSSSTASLTVSSSPHSGLRSWNSRSTRVELGRRRAPVVRPLVVLEDVLAVQVVHGSCLELQDARRRSPARRSAGRCRPGVLCTANDARVVAVAPSRRISGWAQ